MTTNAMFISLRRTCVTATLLVAAGAAQAVDVTGTILTKDEKQFTGVIKWKVSARAYAITAGKIDMEFPPAMVKEIKDKTFVLDFNHPLAGKELQFDVKIVSVEPAPVVPVPAPAPAVVPEVTPPAPEVKK